MECCWVGAVDVRLVRWWCCALAAGVVFLVYSISSAILSWLESGWTSDYNNYYPFALNRELV